MPIAGGSYCKVIPFLNIAQFYEEFKAHWQITNEEYDECSAPSYNRFRAAHLSFGTNIRLMRCKGNFSTCELCLNAAELLRSKKYNKIERRVILDYRRQHLIQQARQREALDEEKLNSLELDSQGQPLQCLFFVMPSLQRVVTYHIGGSINLKPMTTKRKFKIVRLVLNCIVGLSKQFFCITRMSFPWGMGQI